MIAYIGLYITLFSLLIFTTNNRGHEIKEHIQYCREIKKKVSDDGCIKKTPTSKYQYIIPCQIVGENEQKFIVTEECLEKEFGNILPVQQRYVCNFYYLFEDPQPEFVNFNKRRVSFWQHYDFLCACLGEEPTIWDALRIYLYIYPDVLLSFLRSKVFQAERGILSREKTPELYSLLTVLLNVFFSCDKPKNAYYLVVYGLDTISDASEMLNKIYSDLEEIGLSVNTKKHNDVIDTLKQLAVEALQNNKYYEIMSAFDLYTFDCFNQFNRLRSEKTMSTLQQLKKQLDENDNKKTGFHIKKIELQNVPHGSQALMVPMKLVGTMSMDYFSFNIQNNYFPHEQIQKILNGEDVFCETVDSQVKQGKRLDECYKDDEEIRDMYNRRGYSTMTFEEMREVLSLEDLMNMPDSKMLIPNTILNDNKTYFYQQGVEQNIEIKYNIKKHTLFLDSGNLLKSDTPLTEYSKKYCDLSIQSRQKMLEKIENKPTLGIICSIFAMNELTNKQPVSSLCWPYDYQTRLLFSNETESVCYALDQELSSLKQKIVSSPEGSLIMYEQKELDINKFVNRVNHYLFDEEIKKTKTSPLRTFHGYGLTENAYNTSLYDWVNKISSYFQPCDRDLSASNDSVFFVLDSCKVREAMEQVVQSKQKTRCVKKQHAEQEVQVRDYVHISLEDMGRGIGKANKIALELDHGLIQWMQNLSTDHEKVISFMNPQMCFPYQNIGTACHTIEELIKPLTISSMEVLSGECVPFASKNEIKIEQILKSPDLVRVLSGSKTFTDTGIRFSLAGFLKFYEIRSSTSIEIDLLDINHYMDSNFVASSELEDEQTWLKIFESRNYIFCSYHMVSPSNLFASFAYDDDSPFAESEYLGKMQTMRTCGRKRIETFSQWVNNAGVGFDSVEQVCFSRLGFIEEATQLIRCVYCYHGLFKDSKGLFPIEALYNCHSPNCSALKIMNSSKGKEKIEQLYKNKLLNIRNLFKMR